MRRLVGIVTFGMLAVVPSVQAQVDPYEIMDRVDQLYRGAASHGTSTMEVVTENWDRQMTMEMWSLGNDFSLVRILAPAREAGTATQPFPEATPCGTYSPRLPSILLNITSKADTGMILEDPAFFSQTSIF